MKKACVFGEAGKIGSQKFVIALPVLEDHDSDRRSRWMNVEGLTDGVAKRFQLIDEGISPVSSRSRW